MATQRYRHKSDKTVGENESSPTRATHPGAPELNVPKGGENKTPSPTRPPTTTPDMARTTSWGRSSGDNGDNPGKQGFGGPSSLNPGEAAGKATINANAKTDAVLDGLVRGGVKGLDQQDSWQTRRLDDAGENNRKASPVHPNMRPANAGGAPAGTVPAKCGAPVSAPVRQPGK